MVKNKKLKERKASLSKKLHFKKTFKENRLQIRMKEEKPSSILLDSNRFFNDEFEETKRSLI